MFRVSGPHEIHHTARRCGQTVRIDYGKEDIVVHCRYFGRHGYALINNFICCQMSGHLVSSHLLLARISC